MHLYRIWPAMRVAAFGAVLVVIRVMLAQASFSLWELAAAAQIG